MAAVLFAMLWSSAYGDGSPPDSSPVPVEPPRYVESPFRLDDADVLGLPLYLRLPGKPPLFYPRALDVFSWIDLARPNWHSLQELIERPDLADEVFPERPVVETPKALSSVDFSIVEPTEPNKPVSKDPVDQYIARLVREASIGVDEEILTDRMRINSPSEEDLLNGIAYLESLRNRGKNTPEPLTPLVEPSPSAPAETITQPAQRPPPLSQPSLPSLETSRAVSPPGIPDPIPPSKATLRMAAKVSLPDGTQRPAFASEFFLTTRQLEDLLSEAIPYPTAANDVRQLIRLWAESTKRVDSKGNTLALKVKSVLVAAKVSKVDTDLNGEAEVAGLKPDDYYLIGIDKDDETGIVTIWSKPIAISRGENHVEVSAQDVVWSK